MESDIYKQYAELDCRINLLEKAVFGEGATCNGKPDREELLKELYKDFKINN